MSSENALENTEDLENVPLVRMEDVQPRDRSDYSQDSDEVLETCILDDAEYEECVVDDEDSNIGSMVSIQSEEVVECDDNSAELIVPEVLEPNNDDVKPVLKHTETSPKPNRPDSWPTLEILPGGVINLADKNDITNLYPNVVDRDTVADPGEMMYACAKCSQSFKYLFCLVKHVKWHEEEKKKGSGPDLTKLTTLEKELLDVKRARHELNKSHKKKKVEIYSRIAEALGSMDNFKDILN